MVICRICEKEVDEEKAEEHAPVCEEVAKIRDQLGTIREKMADYGRQAYLMQASFATSAAKQKKLHKKQPSKGAMNEPGSPAVASFSPRERDFSYSFSTSLLKTEVKADSTESKNSEEDAPTPMRSQKKRSSLVMEADDVKKLTPEEFDLFMEETNNNIFALNKVMTFSERISQNAFTTGQFDDPDNTSKTEMQIIAAQRLSAKVSEFLVKFTPDLASYIDVKLQFTLQSKKLAQISSSSKKSAEDLRKEKFQNKKSASLKKGQINFRSGARNSLFKDGADSVSHSKEPSKSPNKVAPKVMGSDYITPMLSKRTLPMKSSGMSLAMQSPSLAALTASPQRNSLKIGLQRPDMSKAFLQSNANHIGANSALQAAFKKASEEGLSLRDKIKNATGQKIEVNGAPEDKKGVSSHSSTLTQYKEMAKQRRSRFSMAGNGVGTGSGTGGMPWDNLVIKEEQNAEDGKEDVETKKEKEKQTAVKKARNRTRSLDLFKNLHQTEDEGMKKLPSLLNGLSELTDGSQQPTRGEFIFDKLDKSPKEKKTHKKKKSGSDDDIFANINAVRGCPSDPTTKWKRQLPFLEKDQVTIKDFKFIKPLGKGAYGIVWLVVKESTGDQYAMKIVDAANTYAQNRMQALMEEKNIYEVIQGDFVVKCVWAFAHQESICFVTELMIGGDFVNIIQEIYVRLDFVQAQFYFAELLLAVDSLHHLDIVHRDLKPDNILMDARGHIRLTDFGLSEKQLKDMKLTGSNKGSGKNSPGQGKDSPNLKEPKFLKEMSKNSDSSPKPELKNLGVKRTSILRKSISSTVQKEDKKIRIIGTPDYIAPEIINPDFKDMYNFNKEKYNDKVMDFWSLGVILYEFFVGYPCFRADTREEIFDNILNHTIEWPPIGDGEDDIPQVAYDLINALLDANPYKRLGVNGIQEIRDHPFFNNFNWEGLREAEAPILPFWAYEKSDEPEVKHPLPFSDDKQKPKIGMSQTQHLGFFKMNRYDVLKDLTGQKVKTLQKQRSMNSKMF